MMKEESMREYIVLEYCSRCLKRRSAECRYCESTERVHTPSRFVEEYIPEEPDFKAHADVTMGVK
jgi:hypothetical protein